jgi:hypothetical protein
MARMTSWTRVCLVLSFPLVVATIWLAFAMAASRQRSEIIDRLTAQIIGGNREGSLAAIRALASAPRPLLEPIVRAAASPNRTLAEGSQQAISDLVEQWRLQSESGRNRNIVASGLDDLAAALDQNCKSFPATDAPWLTQIASTILRLANRALPDLDLDLTMHCEALLAAAGQTRVPAISVRSAPDVSSATTATAAARLDGKTMDSPTNNADRETHVTPAGSSAAPSPAESAFSAPPQSAYQAITESDTSIPKRAPMAQTPDKEARWTWPATNGGKARLETEDGSSTAKSNSSANSSTRAAARFVETTQATPDSLKSVDSRALLQRWLSADKSAQTPLESELTRRGLGKPNVEIVRVLFSDRVEDRIRLVQEIMTAPGIKTSAWLQLFTEDEDADVRLAAITLMSTSNNPALMEQAFQATLHDRDPRVADLAGRLRDRRDGVERR